MQNPAVKSALESALVAIIVGGACLWFLISNAQEAEVAPARITIFGLGLLGACCAHLAFMSVALKRAGRFVLPWMLLLIFLFPIASIFVGVMLMNQDDDTVKRDQAGPAV
jgi:dipeptide/tripeptide permease